MYKMISWFKKKRKKIFFFSGILFAALLFFSAAINYSVQKSADGFLYNDVNEIPFRKTALVLGTSKYVANGIENPFYNYRMEAAAALYFAGKAKQFILSGDNGTMSYNEPVMMKNDLLKLGIPDSILFLDYAGFRTFDAMIRAKEIFSQDSITVVSQKFHNTRAIFLAQHFKISAIGFNAKDVSTRLGFRTYVREYFARVNAFLDVTVFQSQPKFLGEKVKMRF